VQFFMKLFIILILLPAVFSCENRHPQNVLDNARQKFKKDAESFNQSVLAEQGTEDSLYALSKLNMDSGINAVNKYILANTTSPKFYKIKGDIYFNSKSYNNAIAEYTKALQLDSFSNAIIPRARCFLKIKQYDSCLQDLKTLTNINYDGNWYLGNYYETRRNIDSAIFYYSVLFNQDKVFYRYCQDRITYLKSVKSPKTFNDFSITDTVRETILLRSID
jgi:tetratricopeptide (TPR) repeat protein